ncbi:MAG: site-specific DNA-methyltransferase [Patescibacteria group bacterium]|nr:site-specific DNA-methyltransferase [Patescibacteria group bacterium]
MPTLETNSVDAIVTDPPYFKVKGEAWDRQWDTQTQFLRWLKRHRDEWHRVLKPNGSLYCFASPKMAARVETLIGGRFNIINRITWQKPPFSTKAEMFDKPTMRGYFPASEAIIFAEHYGADNMAKGEAGYVAKCDELRGFVFEPLRAYLDGERERAGVSVRQVAEAFQRKSGSRTVTGMAGHWFGRVQWMLPTRENYDWLRSTLTSLNHQGEYLRREYEDLRREYEDLRRPFSVSSDVPYTDVWTFPTVPHHKGKHPCEKPVKMIAHMVEASTRPGALVLDPFCGSGTTGVACLQTGRRFLGIEIDPAYCAIARRRIAQAKEDSASLFEEAAK